MTRRSNFVVADKVADWDVVFAWEIQICTSVLRRMSIGWTHLIIWSLIRAPNPRPTHHPLPDLLTTLLLLPLAPEMCTLALGMNLWYSNLCIPCTAKKKCQKFEVNIPKKGMSRSQSQFPHSCVCERIIYSHDGAVVSAGGNKWTDPGNI